MTDASGTGLLLGGLFLIVMSYAVIGIIGGGLVLAHRRSVRAEVERLLRSVREETGGGAAPEAARAAGETAERNAHGNAGGETRRNVGRRDR